MKRIETPLQLIALMGGAVTFGTAYHLLFLDHPAWSMLPFDVFLPVFQSMILNIGMSQVLMSNIALGACMVLFFLSKDRFWLLAVMFLLVSLPVTVWLMMPINLQFIEATNPNLATMAPELLRDWGLHQIIRTIADGLAFLAICKPVIRPKQPA